MNDIIITNAKYIANLNGNNISIQATINEIEKYIPLDPANRHYAEIIRQVEAGTLVIQPADEPPQEEPQA